MVDSSPPVIQAVPSDVGGFIGVSDHEAGPRLMQSFGDFQHRTGEKASQFLACAVQGFFNNGGTRCYVNFAPKDGLQQALAALAKEKLSLLCCPDLESFANGAKFLAAHCEKMADRFCVLHAPEPAVTGAHQHSPVHSSFAGYYHPWVVVTDRGQRQITVPPDGHILGALAQADVRSLAASAGGVLKGVSGLSQAISEAETGELNAQGVNVLRFFAGQGNRIWGGRTTSSDSDWKYIAVRRLVIYIEQSIYAGTQWVVFEPNGEKLWTSVRRAVEEFLLQTWRAGAMQGAKPEDAFFVRCDATTMTQADVDAGRLVVLVGIAPLRPAEFVIFRIGQWIKPGK